MMSDQQRNLNEKGNSHCMKAAAVFTVGDTTTAKSSENTQKVENFPEKKGRKTGREDDEENDEENDEDNDDDEESKVEGREVESAKETFLLSPQKWT
jgi:hypothetical protein